MIIDVPDSPKMLRETLCIAQTAIGQRPYDLHRKQDDMAALQRLIDECDRHRPLGPDGKHGYGERCTETCGCEIDTAKPPVDMRARFGGPHARVVQVGRWTWRISIHDGLMVEDGWRRLGAERAKRKGARELARYLERRDREAAEVRIGPDEVSALRGAP